jgi:hypothetical protein
MGQYKFKPGQYTTRNGCSARVEFVMEQPTHSSGVLVGQRFDGQWNLANWHVDGRYFRDTESPHDLMPPTTLKFALLYEDGTVGPFKESCGLCLYDKPTVAHIFASFDANNRIVYGSVRSDPIPQRQP